MKALAAQIASLGPIGRLPARVASPLSDLVGLGAAILRSGLGFVTYAAGAAILLFGAAAAAGWSGMGMQRPRREPVLGRVAGIMVALGSGLSPAWLAASCAVAFVTMGILRLPPESWLSGWLPPAAVRPAADVLPGAAILGLSLLGGLL